MRLAFATLAALSAFATAAVAQTNAQPNPSATAPSGNMGSSNPAVTVKPKDSPESTGSLEPGANSFTEGQARSRIEAQGFSNVTDLRKDDQGIWRGQAMRNGASVGVAIDYRGNVQAQ